MTRKDVKMLVEKWWDIYNDTSLDFNKKPNELLHSCLGTQQRYLNKMMSPNLSAA